MKNEIIESIEMFVSGNSEWWIYGCFVIAGVFLLLIIYYFKSIKKKEKIKSLFEKRFWHEEKDVKWKKWKNGVVLKNIKSTVTSEDVDKVLEPLSQCIAAKENKFIEAVKKDGKNTNVYLFTEKSFPVLGKCVLNKSDLRAILSERKYGLKCGILPGKICVGVNGFGEYVCSSIVDVGLIGIFGSTGGGKSLVVKAIIASVMCGDYPYDLYVINGGGIGYDEIKDKTVCFYQFDDLDSTKSLNEVISILDAVIAFGYERKKEANISDAGIHVFEKKNNVKLKRVLVVIDECQKILVKKAKKEDEILVTEIRKKISLIANEMRKMGITLILVGVVSQSSELQLDGGFNSLIIKASANLGSSATAAAYWDDSRYVTAPAPGLMRIKFKEDKRIKVVRPFIVNWQSVCSFDAAKEMGISKIEEDDGASSIDSTTQGDAT